MIFDIRATVNGTADSKEAAHATSKILRRLLAEHGFTGVIEVREIGSNEAFIRDVIGANEKEAER